MLAAELSLADSGALDGNLIANQPFYGTNYTKPLLFLEDGEYFAEQATAQHLTGSQWGVMNETGSYPGQPWLWLYTLWYQVPGFDNSANVDLIAIYLTGAATILLLALPFVPGLRGHPRDRPPPSSGLAKLGQATTRSPRREIALDPDDHLAQRWPYKYMQRSFNELVRHTLGIAHPGFECLRCPGPDRSF